DRFSIEGAKILGDSWHPVLCIARCESVTRLDLNSGQSGRSGAGSHQSLKDNLLCFKPSAVCWYCLPVVHRCRAKSPGNLLVELFTFRTDETAQVVKAR